MSSLSSNNTLVSALYRTEAVVVDLQARGVEVKGVVVREGQPVIRIQRHTMCDYLLTSGKASYIEYGQGKSGKYRQGVFVQDGCRVVWSESIH
ncbi:hypothetical protein RI049_21610 [Cedecea neteri]|uniref:hypothetical protein n=1 Tax=Cedecea neteri TaxID=158822 RepID=UPI002AA7554D|nr:hypothetical protein [Cedecea neteri]WPU22596.1 hypothetical protein RI049_21610 [Cedecea neteri]